MWYLSSDLSWDKARRAKACEWLVGHGINPTHVPMWAAIDLDGDYLEIEVMDTTANGLAQWDTETQRIKTRWLRVKCSDPFPDDCLEM